MCSRVLAEWGLVIDNFHTQNMPKGVHYFLTHLHLDHMSGLSMSWNKAPMHVSESTWKLMEKRYGTESPVVLHATVWEPYEWNNLTIMGQEIEVVCIPAHHCAGSVMWIFKLPTSSTVVFTGDYRLHPNILEWEGWKNLRPVSLLLYDSSLNDPRIAVPTTQQSLSAIHNIYRKMHKTQRLCVLTQTGGTEQLVAEFCNTYKIKWHVDPSCKNMDETVFGLLETAKKHQGTPQTARVWCVGDDFRTQNEGDSRYVYVRPSAIWFLCYRNRLERENSYAFGDAVPDETNTFRVFYSSHASYQENQTLIRHLRPQMTSPCVVNINPTNCERNGTSLPQWDYYHQLQEESAKLRPYRSAATNQKRKDSTKKKKI